MYLNALEFLEEERDAWRPFEVLDGLTDDRLEAPLDGAHGWSGRDLIGHLVAWQAYAIDVARELAVGERSLTKERLDRDWDERGGETINREIQLEWQALPLGEVRARFRGTSGELRGYLTVVPEARWLKNGDMLHWFLAQTIDHYAEHRADLDAVLEAASA